MIGKKIFILIFIVINNHAMQRPQLNMEESLEDLQVKKALMHLTPEHQAYEEAKQLHEKLHTPETNSCMEKASELALKTPQCEAFLQAYDRHEKLVSAREKKLNSHEAFSDNVFLKHRAMENTPEYIEYEAAKEYHATYQTPDTQQMVDECKIKLHTTKECQEWLRATEQEIDVVNNVMKSQTCHTTQSNFFKISDKNEKLAYATNLNKRVENLRNALENTPEYQQGILAHIELKKYNKPKKTIEEMKQASKAALALEQATDVIKNTKEMLEYCKSKEEVRQFITQVHNTAPIIIESNCSPCLVNYLEHEKYMHKHDLVTIPIIPIQKKENRVIIHIIGK